MKNTSTQETPRVLRRSSRLEKLKASRDVVHTEAVLKKPERILSNTLSFKDQINSIFTTDSFRYVIKLYLFYQVCYKFHAGGC